MRQGLLLGALCLSISLLSQKACSAELPPIVVQLAAPGKILDDIRAIARAVGGEPLVKEFNNNLESALGEKGLSGLDLNRPTVFGIYLREAAGDPNNQVFIIGLASYTNEADFVALLKHSGNSIDPVPGKKGRYLFISKDEESLYIQFADGFVLFGGNMTEGEFDRFPFPKYEQLLMPGETALVSARFHLDRMPASIQKQWSEGIDKTIAEMASAPLPADAKAGVQKATEKISAAFKGYIEQLKEVKSGVMRVVFDPATADVSLEIGVVGQGGSSLARDIAARPRSTNRFTSFVGKETAAALLLALPLGNPDIREGIATAFLTGGKEALDNVPPEGEAVLSELLEGIDRTIRSGEVDLGLAANGPDRDGHFSLLAGVSFDNPKKLETEIRKLYKMAPAELKAILKLDAAKIGEHSVHIARLGPMLPPEAQQIFGDEAELAIIFAPKGVYLAFGIDPVGSLRTVVNSAPQQARGLDVLVNPNRLEKLISAIGGPEAGAKIANNIGVEDKLASALFISTEGGPELKIRFGMNLKIIPKAIFMASPSSIGLGEAAPIREAPPKP